MKDQTDKSNNTTNTTTTENNIIKQRAKLSVEIMENIRNLSKNGDYVLSSNYIEAFMRIIADPHKDLTTVRQEVGVSQATMWRITDKLEEFDLGRKVNDPFDHRVYYFKPSQRARDIFKV